MKAKLFTLHVRDLIKGLILATITAIITFIIGELQAGTPFDIELFKRAGITALIAFLSYILKNFLTNNNDEFLTADK